MTAKETAMKIFEAIGEDADPSAAIAASHLIVRGRDQQWERLLAAEASHYRHGMRSSGSSRYARQRYYDELDEKQRRIDSLRKDMGVK